MSKKREMSESGMLVYPKLPMPKRESEPRMPKAPRGSDGSGKLLLLVLLLGLGGGGAAGFFARPMILEDSRVVDAENALAKQKLENAEAMQTIGKLQEESKKLDEQRELLNKQVDATKQAQDVATGKEVDTSKIKADLDATKKKLDGTGVGTVTIEGAEVRLVIADKNLFKSGDELSGGGNKVLDKVAAALKELPNTQVAVHGHTDDTPPPKPPAPKAPKPSKDKKDKTPPPPPAPKPEFATNWELSAMRSLAVIHYLQDTHKIDATRLSAEAFSQYRPASKKDKAANRRIELVLTQKPKK